jgi:hypothetical protein
LTCNVTTDFRTLSNNRCVPIIGYYESNTTVSGRCHSSCVSCNSSAECLPCSARYYRNITTYACELCPLDCYTCSSTNQSCLSCNASVDHRELNSSTGRCQPILGYYESNVTVAGQCTLGCTHCTSAANCSTC